MFVDLTAAYDTVWHRDLTCKLLRLLPDRHMVRMIMEMVSNHSFTLTTGNRQRPRGASINLQGGASAYALYDMESF